MCIRELLQQVVILGRRLQPLWDSAAEYLKSIGVGIYQAHFDQDYRRLAHELGVSQYPSFVGVFSGRVVRFVDLFS